MKICIDIGHNCINDIGMTANINEDSVIYNVGHKLMEKLINSGHTVLNCMPYNPKDTQESLSQRVVSANNKGADLFISLHLGLGNESIHGSEAFGKTEYEKALATSILSEICKEDFEGNSYNNIGVKNGEGIFVLDNTNMPSILLNLFKADSTFDESNYTDSLGADFIAEAIATGVENFLYS